MLIFDLESDNLLQDVTTIHCLVIYDTETEQTLVYNDKGTLSQLYEVIQLLEDADTVCGHNIISYDLPVLRKLYPWFDRVGDCIDTLLLSRLYHPNLMEIDKKNNWKTMPLKLYGRHSLEAYGHRLNEYKGEFGKDTDWKEWSEEMQLYCIQDVTLTTKLWHHFQKYLIG